MSQASLFARDKVSSCVLYCGRRCVPRASPLEFPATHFFSYSNRAPKQRDNECTQQPCRRPPVRFCFRFSRPYLSQIPAGVARERSRKRERERERSGSSLIIHHRVQPGETKMAALLPSANTLSSKEDSPRELSRSRPPRSGLTTTLFARPLSLFFFSLRFETRRPCLADTDEDYQFSSVDDSKDSRREGGRERKRNRYAVLIGE